MKNLIMIAIGVALGIAGYMVVNEYCGTHSATVKIQSHHEGSDSNLNFQGSTIHHGYDNGASQQGEFTHESNTPNTAGNGSGHLTKQIEKDVKKAQKAAMKDAEEALPSYA